MAWHLSDLHDIVVTCICRELADAVGGLVELCRDVLDLRRRVLLVRGPPTLRLLRVPGCVRVVRMLVRVTIAMAVTVTVAVAMAVAVAVAVAVAMAVALLRRRVPVVAMRGGLVLVASVLVSV